MKKKGIGILICIMLVMIAIPQYSADITDKTNGNDERDFNAIDQSDNLPSLNTGKAFFGIVMINATEANGLPDPGYMGVLSNVDATFSGNIELLLANMFTPTNLVTNQTVHVNIDLFWGNVEMDQENTVLMGFVKGITWEW